MVWYGMAWTVAVEDAIMPRLGVEVRTNHFYLRSRFLFLIAGLTEQERIYYDKQEHLSQ